MANELSDELKATFTVFCKAVPDSLIGTYCSKVEQRLESYQNCEDFLGPNIDLANKIGRATLDLLGSYSGLTDDHKALVIGAVEYFLLEDDSTPDATPIVGFDDDAQVLNHVLEALGRGDQMIDLDN